jgi:hypothetical protein
MIQRIALCICLLFAVQGIASADIFTEDFDNIATLPGAGWALINNSAPLGSTGWFQGNPGIFPALAGPPESYIAANFLNAASGGNISNWLLTPEIPLVGRVTISFNTRTEMGVPFADRMELRLSTGGASTDVGATDASVGDFSTLLLTINPALDPAGYPDAWTQVTAAVSGLPAGTTGRFAFRYFVPDTNTNADYIGIDTVSVTAVPEPAAITGFGLVLASLAVARKARDQIRRRV